MDPGKFLEEQLRRTQSDGIGPKRLDPNNLIKGDLPRRSVAPADRRGRVETSIAHTYVEEDDDDGW